MRKLLQRFREPLILGALLLAPLANYLASGHRGREPNAIDRFVLGLSSPVQSGITRLLQGIERLGSDYLALVGAQREARECRAALAEAHAELNALEEAKSENTRLRAVAAYVEGTVEEEIAARVIGTNPSPLFKSIRIDRGEDDGVRAGMPVVTPEGVVGEVVRSVAGSADVLLVTDPTSHIGALLQRTRARGSVSGTGDGRLTLGLVRREEEVQTGDVVVTAGSDGVFPPGLVVGKVGEVSRQTGGMFLSAEMVPAVELAKIEEVLIIPVTLGMPFSSMARGGFKK
jgi:rod shape-determining protein MreC